MVRRYEEPIEVRAGVAGEGAVDHSDINPTSDIDHSDINRTGGIDRVPGPTPSAFLWRGRLYIVRGVIGYWRERRAWWREALDPDEEDTRRGVSATHGLDCLEQEVWRVEASPGRLAGTGVYDLGMNDLGKDGGLGMDGPVRGWRLLRVAD